MGMQRVGYSQLATFWLCPYKHFLRYWEKAPERVNERVADWRVRGSLAQKTMELFYERAGWRSPRPLDAFYECIQLAAPEAQGKAGLVAELIEWAPIILQTMRDERLVAERAGVELPVSLVVGKVSIEGRADLVLQHAGVTTLLDGKIGSTGDRDQLLVYALALGSTDWGFPARIGQWFYRKGVTWIKLTPAKLAKFQRELAEVVAQWMTADNTARVGSHCKSCGFAHRCEAYSLHVRSKQAAVPMPDADGMVSFD